MTDKPSLNTIMRWISHYAEDNATLHPYELSSCTDPDRAERAAYWRKVVNRRHDEVWAALNDLVAGDPGLHMRIADTIQRELDDSADTDQRFLGERIASALCAEVPEIGRAVR
jgi:hypothetical protein